MEKRRSRAGDAKTKNNGADNSPRVINWMKEWMQSKGKGLRTRGQSVKAGIRKVIVARGKNGPFGSVLSQRD
jgi:hypothetical protein